MTDKDCNSLRPFDLDAAKRGEMLCWYENAQAAKYIAGPDVNGTVAIEWAEKNVWVKVGQLEVVSQTYLRMAPLCWVEERPVYKGDVLYANNVKRIVSGVHTYRDRDTFIDFIDGFNVWVSGPCGGFGTTLAWPPPKVKREGWVNIYPRTLGEWVVSVSNAYPTKEAADAIAKDYRIDCVRIEWEEPAK